MANWPTSGCTVHRDTDVIARRLIDSCIFLTPAEEYRIDHLLQLHTPEKPEKAPTFEPDEIVLAELAGEGEDTQGRKDKKNDWLFDEPSDAALLAIQNAGV